MEEKIGFGMIRVVFIGPECSGKTSMAEWVKSELGIPFSKEFARDFAEGLDRPIEVGDVEGIAWGQIWNEEELEKSGIAIGILDTNILSSLFYSKWYFDHEPAWLIDLVSKKSYDHYYLFYPDPEFETDVSRASEDKRLEMLDSWKHLLEEHGISYKMVQGDKEKRESFLKREIEAINDPSARSN